MGTWVTEAINFSETDRDQKAMGRHMQSAESIKKKLLKILNLAKLSFKNKMK